MKRIIIIVASIVVLVFVAVGALVVFPPKGWVQSQLVQQVKNATGRDLAINGPMSLRLLPRVVLRLEDVALSNPPGGPPTEPLFAARAILVETELWPLLFGRPIIDQVSLAEPRMALSVDPQGQTNWITTQGGGQPISVRALAISNGAMVYRDGRSGESLQLAGIEGGAKDVVGDRVAELTLKSSEVTVRGATSGPAVTLKALDAGAKAITPDKVGEVTLKAAMLLYRQGEGSAPIEVEGPQVSAKSVSRAGPIEAAIAFILNKDPVAGNLWLRSPASLIEGKPSPVSVRLAAPKGKLDLDGSVGLAAGAAKLEGKASADAGSLRSLAKWLGTELPKNDAFGAVSVESDVRAEGKRITLDNAKLALDATKTTGSLTMDFSGARPLISGRLSADEVDANSYLETQAPAAPKKARVRSLPVAASPTAPAVPVTEALKAYLRAQLAALDTPGQAEPEAGPDDPAASQERTRSLAAAAEWSDDAIDLSGLKTVDADLSLSVAKLTIGDFELGVPELKAALKDGMLSLDAKNLSLEGGRITGTASVDVRDGQPKLATKFKGRDVDTLAVFETIGQNALLAGKASVDADLRGSGNSLRKLVETLTGRLKAETSKGAIVGYDFYSWAGLFNLGQYDPDRRTPFDELEADVALTNGIASKSSVQVAGPILGVTANGILRIPSREIDYRARLNLASLWGQTVAVRVLGAWLQPKLDYRLGGFTSSRSLDTQGSPLEALKDADLKDPELAGLVAEVLKKAGSTGKLPPPALEALEGLKARAEGRQ